jgi:hypothetical protein
MLKFASYVMGYAPVLHVKRFFNDLALHAATTPSIAVSEAPTFLRVGT